MHTTALRSTHFQITLGGHPASIAEVFPGFTEHDRLGIVIHEHHAAAGAGNLILAAVTAFYDRLRAGDEPFFAYPDYFAFHVGAPRGTLRKLDVYPAHKEVVVPADAGAILEAINDRGVTRLLVPDGPLTEPELARETRHSAQRGIRTALAYAPGGHPRGADVEVRGSAQSDGYIHAMVDGGDAPGSQGFRRIGLDEAFAMLAPHRG